jgi:hypothetical protein
MGKIKHRKTKAGIDVQMVNSNRLGCLYSKKIIYVTQQHVTKKARRCSLLNWCRDELEIAKHHIKEKGDSYYIVDGKAK